MTALWPATRALPLAGLALESPRLLPLVVALVAAVGVGVIALYLPQAAALKRRWRWMMAVLRITALAALGASILQPVINRPPRPEELGAVVVVVDRSRGMGVIDRQRTPAQLVALADGLGRLPPGVRYRTDDFSAELRHAGEQLDRLSAVVAEISFARMRGLGAGDADVRLSEAVRGFGAAAAALTSRRPALRPKAAPLDPLAAIQKSADALRALPPQQAPDRAWIDATRAALDRLGPAIESMQTTEDYRLHGTNKQVRATCDELHALSRLGLVEKALASPETGLLAAIPPRVPVFGFAAGTTVEPLPLKSDGRPVRSIVLEAGGPGADSGALVRAALDQLRGAPVQAVVLFSGGHETAGVPAVVSGVPVFAVAAAAQAYGRDLSISIRSAPDEVAVGEPATIRVRVHGVNLRGTAAEVRFTAGPPRTPPPIAPAPSTAAIRSAAAAVAGGAIDVDSRRVVLGDDSAASLSFTAVFDTPGAHTVRARVADLAGEITAENNAAEQWIKVIGEKTRVAMVAGSPGWDFRSLRGLLEADPRFAVTCQVLAEGEAVSLTPREILSQQVVVLYDVPCNALSREQWDAVKQMVAERGGSAVLIAGLDHLPNERGTTGPIAVEGDDAPNYLAPGPAADLLPFVLDKGADGRREVAANWRIWQGQDAVYQFVPAPSLAGAAWLQLADSAAENARHWNSLPPVYGYLSIPPLKPSARPLLVERTSAAPVVTEHALGGGQVLFVGTTETWRWRYKAGERDHERLWTQLLRHTVEPTYAASASDDGGRYSLDVPAAVTPWQPAPARVRFRKPDGAPFTADAAKVRVARQGAEVATVSLAPAPLAPGRFAGTLPPLPRGDYTVELSSPHTGRVAATYPLHVAARDDLEVQDVTGNRAGLARLAEGSGGELLSIEQVNTLPARLEAHRLGQTTPTTMPLWDSGYLFLFVLGCLAAEWSLRKRAGLA